MLFNFIAFQTTGVIRACPKEPQVDLCAPCGGGFYVDDTLTFPTATALAGGTCYDGALCMGTNSDAITTPEACQAKCAVSEFDSVVGVMRQIRS